MTERESTTGVFQIDRLDGPSRNGKDRGRAAKRGLAPAALRDVSAANVAAGMVAGLWYAFGAIPLFLGAAAKLHLAPEVAAQWLFATCATAAISSIALSVLFRQPLAIGWTIPGLVFLATAGGRFAFQEVMGACMLAGLIVTALGLLGAGERVMRWVPLPVVLGMFAGSSIGYVTGLFNQLEGQPAVAGAALVAYVACWALGKVWLPPIGGAVVAGVCSAVWTGQVHAEGLRWGVPAIIPTMPSLSVESFLTLTLPLVVMVVGLGNVQGIGFLMSEGYRPPIKLLTVVVGITSVVNALLGGHPSTIQRGGTAIVAGRDAGPVGSRYVAALIASAWALLLAFTATTSQSMADVLPMGVVSVFAGLAILSPLMDALKRAMAAERSAGAFVAFVVSMSSMTALGLDSAFWALASGWLVYRLLDRPARSKPAVGVHEDTIGEARKRAA